MSRNKLKLRDIGFWLKDNSEWSRTDSFNARRIERQNDRWWNW